MNIDFIGTIVSKARFLPASDRYGVPCHCSR
jgi:hypothetical protein